MDGSHSFRPLVYMNDTYLVLVNIPGNAGKFYVFFISLVDMIVSCSIHLNQMWQVKGDELISKNSASFLKKLEDPDLSCDLIRFEDDKILIRFENLKVFFDLRSTFNENQGPEGSQREWLEKADLQIRLPAEISNSNLLSLGTEDSKNKSNSKFKFRALTPLKNCPLEKEKNIFELKSESDEESFNNNPAKPKSQLRKQIYFGIKQKIFRLACVDRYVIDLYNLKTISVDRQKEWVLRQLKRRKTNTKNTFKRRLYI